MFKPATIKEIGGHRVAVIGQAFPYVPIAHPKRFTPDWTFGIRDDELQKLVDTLRNGDKVDAVVLLSHNGMDVDLKLASRVTGIDVILGGHTHDAVPQPIPVTNAGGITLVTNAGSNGKFLGVLDLEIAKGKVADVRYRLLPVFSELLKPDPDMAALIDEDARAARGGLCGEDRDIGSPALSPRQFQRHRGPGDLRRAAQRIRCRDRAVAGLPLGHQRAAGPAGDHGRRADARPRSPIRRPTCSSMTGGQIKDMLEDVCDNLFNADPYYQQGGDMVRVGGLAYTCSPDESVGQRISDLKLDNGKPLEAGKSYKVAGWASVNEQQGVPVWDVFAKHLRSGKPPSGGGTGVTLKGVEDNPGIAEQG